MTDDPWAVPGSAPRPADVLYGYPTPPRRSRAPLIWAIVVIVVLLVAGGGVALGVHSHHASHVAKTLPVPAVSSAPPSSAAPAPTSAPPASGPPVSAPPGVAASPAPQSLGPDNPGTGPLDTYVLSPTEVGNVVMVLEDSGRDAVNTPTLNYCNSTYASESLRKTRLQVDYLDDAGEVPVSNEFVEYQPGGTTMALTELQHAAATCPATFTSDGYVGSQIVREPANPALLPHQLVLSYDSADPANPSPNVWWTIVYQLDGNYFSGVYVYGPTRAESLALADKLGADSAKHLEQAVAGKPGTGGGTFAPLGSPSNTGGVQV